MAGSVWQPFSRMSSASESRVPLVEGGPKTEMGMAGRLASTSFHVCALFGPLP